MDVTVIGGGIAGLALAHQLAPDHDLTVLEASPGPRGGGYMIDFFGPGFVAAERMGIIEELRARGHVFEGVRYGTPDGAESGRIDVDSLVRAVGGRCFSILRPEVELGLLSVLPGSVDLRYGARAVAVRDIALDGGRLAPGRPGRARRRHHARCGSRRGLRRRALAGAGEGRARSRGDRPDGLPRGELPLPGPAARRGAGGADAHDRHRGPGGLGVCGRGRIVLAGDAAHAPSLLAGQGTSLAIAGAEALARSLRAAGPHVEVGLAGYERRWRPTAEKIQRMGRRSASFFAPANQLQLRLQQIARRAVTLPGASLLAARTVIAP